MMSLSKLFGVYSVKMNILRKDIGTKYFIIHQFLHQSKRSTSYDVTRTNLILSKDSRVVCQGFTGNAGSLHSKLCMEYGTKMVGGVNPKKGGQKHLGLPVFATIREAKEQTDPHATVIFVPPPTAAQV